MSILFQATIDNKLDVLKMYVAILNYSSFRNLAKVDPICPWIKVIAWYINYWVNSI